MSAHNSPDAAFIGTVLEGLCYGLYCVIFFLYLLVHKSKKRADRILLIYPLSALFFPCTVFFVVDFSNQYFMVVKKRGNHPLVWRLTLATDILFPFIDFISQGILIYRCWVVWGRRLLVVVIPSISAIASLAALLALVTKDYFLEAKHKPNELRWFTPVSVSCFTLSLAVNATLTGLLVFKICTASLALQRSPVNNAHRRGRNEFRLVSMLVESGVVLCLAQLVWIIFLGLRHSGFYLLAGPVVQLYGIVPTFIMVWVAIIHSSHKIKTLSEESGLHLLDRT